MKRGPSQKALHAMDQNIQNCHCYPTKTPSKKGPMDKLDISTIH